MSGVFDRIWDRSQRITTEGVVNAYFNTLSRSIRRDKGLRRATIEEHLAKIEARFSERKKIQRAIHQTLQAGLVGTNQLLDIFSGEPTVVLPLVEEGVVRSLTLVDAQIDASITTLRAQLILALSSRNQQKVEDRRQAIIGGETLLPTAEQVTFIESGLTLPEFYRCRDEDGGAYDDSSSSDIKMAPFIRSGHIGPTTVRFEHVLAALSGANSRTLHVFDTASVLRPLSESDHRAYVEAAIGYVNGWKISEWTSLEGEAPVRYGVLHYEG